MSPTPQSAPDVPKKTEKRGQKKTVCFTAVELQKNVTWYLVYEIFLKKYSYVRVLLIDGEALKNKLGHSTRKTNPTTWNHIYQLPRHSRGP